MNLGLGKEGDMVLVVVAFKFSVGLSRLCLLLGLFVVVQRKVVLGTREVGIEIAGMK
jgi:hypothetical protein